MTAQEKYSHGHHESVLKSHTWRTIENSAAYLSPHLREGLTVLDVGCGPGTITIEFAERVFPARVVGLDASAEVIAKAAALAAERGVENVEFMVGEAYDLPFTSGSFDVVHAHQTLQHVARPVDVLREMRRTAGPTGLVAARDVDYAGTFWYPQLPGLDLWMRVYQGVHSGNGGEPNAGRRMLAWAREAGFASIDSSVSVWNFADDADRDWWGSMWEARVLQSAFAADALGTGLATQEDLEEISRAWRGWADSPDGWLAMPHGEILCRG